MTRKDDIYTLDRFEGNFAVLIDSRGGRTEVPAEYISAEEGDKLRCNGTGFEVVPDSGERAEIKAKMNRLFKRR